MKHEAIRRFAYFVLVVGVVALVPFSYKFIQNDNLNAAASAGNLKVVNVLLAKGVDVDGRGMHYMTPLMSAAKGGHTNVVLVLLAKGADVNAHNDSGSVLMWAAASGNISTVRVLLNKDVDVQWKSNAGDTALEIAKEYKHSVIVNMLKRAGAT